MKKALFANLLFTFFLIALDAASKMLAMHHVAPIQAGDYPFGGIAVFNIPGISFSLNTVVNTGIACGLFPNYPTALLILRLGIIAALFVFLLLRSEKPTFPLWLIAAGALGNIIDMISYGWVIDFLHFRFFDRSFPIFNFADSLITIGAALLVLRPKLRASCLG